MFKLLYEQKPDKGVVIIYPGTEHYSIIRIMMNDQKKKMFF